MNPKFSRANCSECGIDKQIPSNVYFNFVLVKGLKFICHDCRGDRPNFI